MNDLLKKDAPFKWTDEHDDAIQEIKKRLTSAPLLKIYDNTKETIVATDGSSKGVGATLLQKFEGVWHPVFFLSKRLNETQQRWGTSQTELYSIMLSLNRWRPFLIDKKFTILTDHNALTYLDNPKLFEGRRLRRWQALLSEFQFQVVYRKGCDHGLADVLSRNAGKGSEVEIGMIRRRERQEEEIETLRSFIGNINFTTPGEEVVMRSIVKKEVATNILAHIGNLNFQAGNRVSCMLWKHISPEHSWPGTVKNKVNKGSKRNQNWYIVNFF